VLYAGIVTRPDIAYAVQSASKHLQRNGPEHLVNAKRILRYLKGTVDMGIRYSVKGGSKLTGFSDSDSTKLLGYSDADWGGDKDTRRSTTGYVFVLAGGAVSWCSRLQPTVALSSAEAEYTAACAAVQEATHLRQLLQDLGFPQEEPTLIMEDNQGCIALSGNPVLHKRTKHIDIKYHFIRERVASQEVALKYVATADQLADILTKPLLRVRLEKMRDIILGYEG
jgi:hypothetical protein